ncbi:hypothetical protein LTR53_000324 [Teratosphaeriaceae sp. CCFEE 6253]|nr:hypothetical protein LTR53_000324 [Teratosphaeriaceae sp. CCFEE 6253]
MSMNRLCRARTPARSHLPKYRHSRTFIADAGPFRPGDHVLLRPTKDRNASPILTKPLRAGQRLDTHRGAIRHDDLIGKNARELVRSAGGRSGTAEYRLHELKLEEYVRLTRRLVTPLYPQDAQLIVGLLDLHPEPPRWGESDSTRLAKLEILEAGTGHGALTLYLSRAIHAANPPLPRPSDAAPTAGDEEESDDPALEAWKATRRAVIHSIEISAKSSTHAEKVVRGFRHGMYSPNVDFHVGDVSAWSTALLASRGDHQPCLSHAFLDLPGTEHHLGAVTAALRTDGTLVVFCPSITQIMACLSTVKEDGVPLELEKVIELGVNGGTGGREWDVRAVKPRAAAAAAAAAKAAVEVEVEVEVGESREGSEAEGRTDSAVDVGEGQQVKQNSPEEGWKMVCRPKVGDMVVGGGFLGVFKKQRNRPGE